MQNESRHRWETVKELRVIYKSAAPSLNNLKRFTLSGILLELKIIKKHRNACTAETQLHKHNNN